MKTRVKEMGLNDVRVNNAGCLERCELGPTMVIYPDGIWYHYSCPADADEILESHILNGHPVERLLLKDGQKYPEPSSPPHMQLVVAEILPQGGDLLYVKLTHPADRELPQFTAGAHLDLLLDNDRIRRSYSLINTPAERDYYRIAVKKINCKSGGAEWIFTSLKAGDFIQARYPENTFELTTSGKKFILVGEGVGIAPFLSMVHHFRAIQANFQIHCHVETTGEFALAEELKRISGQRLTIHHRTSDIALNTSLAAELRQYTEGSHLYFSGSGAFVSEAMQRAAAWPREAMHAQYLSPPVTEILSNSKFSISLARYQKTLPVHPHTSVLQVIRNAGLSIDYACETGLCGACGVRVLHGRIEHRDWVLNPTEQVDKNIMMTCVSRAVAGEARLILDL